MSSTYQYSADWLSGPHLGAWKGTLDLDHENRVQPHGPESSRKTTSWGALQSGRTLIRESECCCLSPSVVLTKYQICPWTSVPLSVKGTSSFLPALLSGVNWDDEYMQNSSGNCNALIQIAVLKTPWGPWRTQGISILLLTRVLDFLNQ